MSMEPIRIVIIGNGIGGSALALFLCQAGHSVDIYESRASLQDSGAGFCVAPNGLRVLDKLGMMNDFKRYAAPLTNSATYTSKHRLLTWANYQALAARHGGYGAFGVRRADLATHFERELKSHGIKVHYGKRLAAIYEQEGKVTASFEDNTTAEGDLLIGCDGLRSKTRRYVVPQESPPRFTGANCFFGLAKLDERLSSEVGDGNGFLYYFGRGWTLGGYACEVNSGEYFWYAACHNEIENSENWQNAIDAETLLKRLEIAGFNSACLDLVRHSYRTIIFGLYDRPPTETWRRGRIALMGDAAHPTAPTLGQGANMALEDAGVLSRCIARYPDDIDLALSQFQKARQKRTNDIVAASRQVIEALAWKSWFLIWLRDTFLWFWGFLAAGKSLDNFQLRMNDSAFGFDFETVEI